MLVLGSSLCLKNHADAQIFTLEPLGKELVEASSHSASDGLHVNLNELESESSDMLTIADTTQPVGYVSVFTPDVADLDIELNLGENRSIFERQEEQKRLEEQAAVRYALRFSEGYAFRVGADSSLQLNDDAGVSASTASASDAVEQGETSFLQDADAFSIGADEVVVDSELEVASYASESQTTFSEVSVSTVSNSDAVSAAGVYMGAGGGSGAASSARASDTIWTPDNSIQEVYPVHGIVTLTQADEDDLYIDASRLLKHLVIHVQGSDKLVDGVNQSPTLDGDGQYHGFEVVYASDSDLEIVISLEGIEYFKDLVNDGAGNRAGGAITLFNGGTIVFEDTGTPVLFSGNQSISTTGHAGGGAIFLTGGSSISDLIADFDGNSATVSQQTSTTRYSRGGAIFVGKFDSTMYGYSPTTQASVIGNITGDFTNNSASFGGAIYTGEFGVIGHIEGNFVNNTAEGYKQSTHTQGASGGALRTWKGTIGSLNSDFIGNAAVAHTGMAVGGAVSLDGTIINGGITGHYDGNIAFAQNSVAQGGAYVLKHQSGDAAIVFTNTDFTNNVAATGTSSIENAQGGALFVENSSDIYIVADGEDVTISDNYVVNNASWDADTRSIKESDTSERDYTALYVKGSTVTLHTVEGTDNIITINDGIRDDNNASTTSTLVVQDNSSERYGVRLNGEIGIDHLRVESGGVELGHFTHSDGSVTTGSFTNQANLTVSSGAIVKANADYLKNVGHVSLQGIDESTSTLELTGGTLLSDINAGGARTGYIDVLAETTVAGASTFNADKVNVGDTFYLTDSTTVNVETLIFTGYGVGDVNDGGNQIIADNTTTFAFDMIELNFATANPGDIFELIVAAEGESINIDFDFESIVFTVAGQELVDGRDYRVLQRADGGVDVEILIKVPPPPIPEPSPVMLSLLSLGAALTRRRRA